MKKYSDAKIRSTLLWYLNQEGDLDLENINRFIDNALDGDVPFPLEPESDGALKGFNVCLVVGHEPGGGAKGERVWNLELAHDMASNLEDLGAKVLIYQHRTRSYGKRIREMRAGINKHMPNAHCVLLLHYNSVDFPEAHGHEFHYYGYPAFASAIRDRWQSKYPWSRARRDNGIMQNRNEPGSYALELAPAPACLTEPFFESNPEEREKLHSDIEGVSNVYVSGISDFLLNK